MTLRSLNLFTVIKFTTPLVPQMPMHHKINQLEQVDIPQQTHRINLFDLFSFSFVVLIKNRGIIFKLVNFLNSQYFEKELQCNAQCKQARH